ncbi:hypothetical protein [Roseococcus sp. YIM B11640]|uniref:hypothetical protein n=1 Tax=Roseococcus sp. YIM B11640 TaxID=3133973 RepID=UPI003C7DEA94
MAKKPTNTDASEAQDEDLTPYPTQAQNDAAKLGGRKPHEPEGELEADDSDGNGHPGAEEDSREMKAAGGAEYKTR